MAECVYELGEQSLLETLFPPASLANADVGLRNYADVIGHYTEQSLEADGFTGVAVSVRRAQSRYEITVRTDGEDARLEAFATRHQTMLGPAVAGKAATGMRMMKDLGVWNPMAGFHVNDSPTDGLCKWHLFPPLGLNVVGQRGILLMHYPPWQVLQEATFTRCMTMYRWNTVLQAAGVPEDELSFYRTFVDVNPIAAPGSGQSEYPNDYFPIMMASAFFDVGPERDYIRSMLDLYLAPPDARGKRYTLPLLVCGSPLYDPQAPGWFRAAYKRELPTRDGKPDGIVDVDVLQAGEFRVRPDSARATPYMVANHMIAAGVTGKCMDGGDGKIPDIRTYEAQDLVAATFLHTYADHPDADPVDVKRAACKRWFGNEEGSGPPEPAAPADRQIICALAQMDLFFEPAPQPHPRYSWNEALERCRSANNNFDPCSGSIAPCGSCSGGA